MYYSNCKNTVKHLFSTGHTLFLTVNMIKKIGINLLPLYRRLRELEIDTLDGFVPIHKGGNPFRFDSKEYKLRQQYLDFCALNYKQITAEIEFQAEKYFPTMKELKKYYGSSK